MTILGLMSGTSLDGIDLALCRISGSAYQVLAATTVPYTDHWRQRLASLEHSSALDYAKAHVELGHLYGKVINEFLSDKSVVVDAIASHGHTIFHQPHLGLTTQIGDPDAIAATTGIQVVGNFRTLDVALGGQGAPLVPIGDELLFPHYDACLNLGGIANISYRSKVGGMRYEGGGMRSEVGGGTRPSDLIPPPSALRLPTSALKRIAFDICPCNMALNRLAARLSHPFDPEGSIARRGACRSTLLGLLDGLDFYSAKPPKSLGKEWFLADFWPRVDAADGSAEDLLCTVVHHIARQVAHVVGQQRIGSMLITGGGAFNKYLVECITDLLPSVEVIVPDSETVNYKEAIIFAFLGYLRLSGQVNTLASVTGARCDSVGGTISGFCLK